MGLGISLANVYSHSPLSADIGSRQNLSRLGMDKLVGSEVETQIVMAPLWTVQLDGWGETDLETENWRLTSEEDVVYVVDELVPWTGVANLKEPCTLQT